jgi:hypothetical protein
MTFYVLHAYTYIHSRSNFKCMCQVVEKCSLPLSGMRWKELHLKVTWKNNPGGLNGWPHGNGFAILGKYIWSSKVSLHRISRLQDGW